MGLFDWCKQVLVSKYDNIEEHTLSIQKWIMETIIILFIGLMVYSLVFVNKDNYSQVKEIINTFLPLLTAWIGAIIAFYFSKELHDLLAKKIRDYQKEKKQTKSDIEQLEKKYNEEKEQLKKRYTKIISELLIELNKGRGNNGSG